MNEMTLDQNEEELFTYEVSDEVLEVAGCAKTAKANTFTQCPTADMCGANRHVRYGPIADMRPSFDHFTEVYYGRDAA